MTVAAPRLSQTPSPLVDGETYLVDVSATMDGDDSSFVSVNQLDLRAYAADGTKLASSGGEEGQPKIVDDELRDDGLITPSAPMRKVLVVGSAHGPITKVVWVDTNMSQDRERAVWTAGK